ncbi:MAG: haloalkane dehalogenase [Actinomycetota bacterium]
MPAYFVVSLDVHDRQRFNTYAKGVIRTIKPHGGWILAASPAEQLEGDGEARNHNVIIRFPTTDDAKAWWDSADYRDIVPIRLESSGPARPYVQPAMEGDRPPVSGLEPPKRFAEVLGKRMAYVEAGEGDPIVFLHGNPTSSYLWRNVIPHLADQGRCIAPDLIGMGDSDKLGQPGPDTYRFVEHRRYLHALLETLDVRDRVTLVVHDWGSALGFDWARTHADAVLGIAYMEAIVRPMSWDEWPETVRPVFEMMRSEAGESAVLDGNLFVEQILPGSVMRMLGDAEYNAYRRPFPSSADRWPTLTWPRELPLGGAPSDVVDVVGAYSEWLSSSEVPKLFVNAKPGAVLTGSNREFARRWPNQTEVTVRGAHYVQEDSPDEIGEAIASWRRGLLESTP